ncbi:MAG: 4-hydroxy-tetrahydrodipicolinate reductase [Bacteroidetes bacterium]|nr:4-hydroxy-tetrahydrodipicolinate reductase [Bacteroidota bacterium]
MRISIVGYGRMGREIEEIALERGHEIVYKIHADNQEDLQAISQGNTDVVIEFTQPDAVRVNLERLIPKSIPLVVGTTGWEEMRENIRERVLSQGTSLVYASNFSLGMNILFRLNKQLAEIMNAHPGYDVFIEDRHHAHKQDSPSGTALSLAEQIVERLERKRSYATPADLAKRAPMADELSIGSVRAGKIVGIHTVSYTGYEDTISLTHEAHNRRGFALGAVVAAEKIIGRRGFFRFDELLWDTQAV